jgi:lipopolysaccharide export system protein LptA
MKGAVTFKKGNLEASSNLGSLFLENYNKKLKYYSLSDDVRLQESLLLEGRPMKRKAFSEKLEGIISEKKVILTGLPKVFQGKDVIKGNRIIIRENIETVEVDDANTSLTLEREKEKL